jgi:hypothetical protein
MRSLETRGELRTGQIIGDQAEETSSAKNQKTKRERRRTCQGASSARRDFRVTVIVIVNDPMGLHGVVQG